MLIENTIAELIGQKFQLLDLNNLEKDFFNLYRKLFSDKIKLITKHNFKLHIIKAGFLNLTFEREIEKTDKYLRVIMETERSGPLLYKSKVQPQFDYLTFVENWETNYDKMEKPIEFTIIDACYTNVQYIWDEKYFYS